MDNIEIANNYYNENLKGKIPGIVALHTNKLASAINGAEPTGEITPINEYLEYFTKSDYLYTDKLPHKARESMMQTASMDFPNVCTAKVPLLFGKEILLIEGNNTIPATAMEIDKKCRLKVKLKDDTTRWLSSGEVSIRIN